MVLFMDSRECGRCWPASGMFTAGGVIDLPLAAGYWLARRHGFEITDGTVLPPRHPEDRPWRWAEVITVRRGRG